MDKFVMMKRMNGTRVRTKDLWAFKFMVESIISIATESRYATALFGLD